MKPILVTGATGFLGWHVARKLLDRGCAVRALVRDPARLRELDVEPVKGDLRDEASLQRAVTGCEKVYHVAADYRLWTPRPQEMYDANVGGTRKLLAASRAAGVERVVYTSTVGCIGFVKGGEGDENTPVSLEDMQGAYKRSKFQAEQVALEFAAQGYPVVIVNPTAPIGDHDFKPTPTGKMVLDYLNGEMPGYLDTGLNVVDAADTAEGHLLAMEKGRPGERYILGSQNLSLLEIFGILEKMSGVRAPTFEVPYWLAYAAGVLTTAAAAVTGKEPKAPIDAVKMARKKMYASHRKAAAELGFAPAPAEAGLRKAAEWFSQNGYLKRSQ